LVRFSVARRSLNTELTRYLYKNLYSNPAVAGPNRRAGKMLEDLFRYYLAHPEELGQSSRKRARNSGWHRAICDYLSGMTDRYTLREHQRLFGQKSST
jgi:dGTPase